MNIFNVYFVKWYNIIPVEMRPRVNTPGPIGEYQACYPTFGKMIYDVRSRPPKKAKWLINLFNRKHKTKCTLKHNTSGNNIWMILSIIFSNKKHSIMEKYSVVYPNKII